MNNQIINNANWTFEIKPKKGWFELNLNELWRYRDLIYLFFRRDFVAKYKQTILGPLWFIIQPLLTTLMFTVVFGKIAGISTDGVPKILFYLSGIVAWNYFSTVLTETSSTFTKNAYIFGKVYFPRLAIPVSVAFSSLIKFVIQFILLVGFMIYFAMSGTDLNPGINLLLIPLIIILIAVQSLGFGILISSLTTKYRDFTYLVKFGIQLWMYVTPIIYPLSAIPEKYKLLVMINPMAPLIETFRNSLLGANPVNYMQLMYGAIFSFVILAFGILIFNRIEKNFMDTV